MDQKLPINHSTFGNVVIFMLANGQHFQKINCQAPDFEKSRVKYHWHVSTSILCMLAKIYLLLQKKIMILLCGVAVGSIALWWAGGQLGFW